MKSLKDFMKSVEEVKAVNENSLYQDADEKKEFVEDPGAIIDAFAFGFLGFFGAYNYASSESDNAVMSMMRKYLKRDGKLRPDTISDKNNNTSLVIKHMHDQDFFISKKKATEITRFLVIAKKGGVDYVDDAIVRDWVISIKKKYIAQASPKVKAIINKFIAGEYSLITCAAALKAIAPLFRESGIASEFWTFARRSDIKATDADTVDAVEIADDKETQKQDKKVNKIVPEWKKHDHEAGFYNHVTKFVNDRFYAAYDGPSRTIEEALRGMDKSDPTERVPGLAVSFNNITGIELDFAESGQKEIADSYLQKFEALVDVYIKTTNNIKPNPPIDESVITEDQISDMLPDEYFSGNSQSYLSLLQEKIVGEMTAAFASGDIEQITPYKFLLGFANYTDVMAATGMTMKEMYELFGQYPDAVEAKFKPALTEGEETLPELPAPLMYLSDLPGPFFKAVEEKWWPQSVIDMLFEFEDSRDMEALAMMRYTKLSGSNMLVSKIHKTISSLFEDAIKENGMGASPDQLMPIIALYIPEWYETLVPTSALKAGLDLIRQATKNEDGDLARLKWFSHLYRSFLDQDYPGSVLGVFEDYFKMIFTEGRSLAKRGVLINLLGGGSPTAEYYYDIAAEASPGRVMERFGLTMMDELRGVMAEEADGLDAARLAEYIKFEVDLTGSLADVFRAQPDLLDALLGLMEETGGEEFFGAFADDKSVKAELFFSIADDEVGRESLKASFPAASSALRTFDFEPKDQARLLQLEISSPWLFTESTMIENEMDNDEDRHMKSEVTWSYHEIMDSVMNTNADVADEYFDSLDSADMKALTAEGAAALMDAMKDLSESPINTYEEVTHSKTGEMLRYNNISRQKLTEEYDIKYDGQSTLSEYLQDAKGNSTSRALAPLNISDDGLEMEDRAYITQKFIENHYAGQHGDLFPVVINSFDLTFDSTAYDEFVSLMEGTEDSDGLIIPAFHGSGGSAASMILRYGFKVIPTDSASVVGRMLGDGIYFSNMIDKVAQYVGNNGYGRTKGIRGYIFEMHASLGIKRENYAAAGVTGKDGIRSPEWCVFDANKQLKMIKAYEVELQDQTGYNEYIATNLNEAALIKKSYTQFINEATNKGTGMIVYSFSDGYIPMKSNGSIKYVHALDFKPSGDVRLENQGTTAQVIIPGTKRTMMHDFTRAAKMTDAQLKEFLKLTGQV